jgi:hypothetical protein
VPLFDDDGAASHDTAVAVSASVCVSKNCQARCCQCSASFTNLQEGIRQSDEWIDQSEHGIQEWD